MCLFRFILGVAGDIIAFIVGVVSCDVFLVPVFFVHVVGPASAEV